MDRWPHFKEFFTQTPRWQWIQWASVGGWWTKQLLFHRYVDESRNSLPCLFKNKPIVKTGGKVACWSIPNANTADYPLGLLINLLAAILRLTFWLFFFFFKCSFPLHCTLGRASLQSVCAPWEVMRLKVDKRKTDRGTFYSVLAIC